MSVCPCGAARGRRQKCQKLRSQPTLSSLSLPQKKELPDRKMKSRWFPWQQCGKEISTGQKVEVPPTFFQSAPTSETKTHLPRLYYSLRQEVVGLIVPIALGTHPLCINTSAKWTKYEVYKTFYNMKPQPGLVGLLGKVMDQALDYKPSLPSLKRTPLKVSKRSCSQTFFFFFGT